MGAVEELAKRKLTTDPKRHSGDGIFLSSRVFDEFDILGGGLYFTHVRATAHDWLVEREQAQLGTAVFMKLSNHASRTMVKVLDQFIRRVMISV